MAFRPSKLTYEQVLQSPSVAAALNARGRLVLPRAQRGAADAGRVRMARALRVERGVRPGVKSPLGIKRPYVRVVADLTEDDRKADSRAKVTPRQVLRKAAR